MEFHSDTQEMILFCLDQLFIVLWKTPTLIQSASFTDIFLDIFDKDLLIYSVYLASFAGLTVSPDPSETDDL